MRYPFAFALLFVLAAHSPAASVSYEVTRSFLPGSQTPFVFPGFDPALGDLGSVELHLSAAATTVGGFRGGNGNILGHAFVVEGRLTMTHWMSLVFLGPALLSVVQVDTDTTDVPVPSGQFRPLVFDLPTNTSGPLTLTSSESLLFFTREEVTLFGGGTWRLERLSSSDTQVQGSPTTFVPITATLTYHFVPVSEPSTLALLALGALSVVGVSRRALRPCPQTESSPLPRSAATGGLPFHR